MNLGPFFAIVAAAAVVVTPISAKEELKILSLQPQSDEEAFLVRRIGEFLKDGDYNIVQSQILTFIEKYPDSKMNDHLKGMLGDLYLQKDQFDRALSVYNQIQNKEVKELILINKLQCLYEQGQYDELSRIGNPYLDHPIKAIDARRDEFHFLMAQSYFHRSLTCTDSKLQRQLAQTARPLYESLNETTYKDVARFALAEIYRVMGDYPEAANLYLELSKEFSDQKEELLFHAANLQAQFKPEKAIETFSDIITMDGNRSKEATFNRMLIYYQLGHHHEVIASYDRVASLVPEDKQGVFDLIVGKSYFTLEDYPSAITHLRDFVSGETETTPSLKNAHLMLMTAAYHQGDHALFNSSFDSFKEKFPNDPELSKAIFTHAMLAKAADDREKVQEDLEMLLTQYPDYEDKEGLIFEYASLTYDRADWEKSYFAFQSFLTDHPYSERNEIAWRYFFSAALNLYKEAQSNSNIHYSRNAFFNDLSQTLDQPHVLGDEERREYRLLQAKTAFELDLFDVAYHKLKDYIHDYDNDPSLAEAHFISGLASKEINHDLQPACYHLEKALEMNPEEYDSTNIHLELYNAYLTLSSLSQGEDPFLSKAASHLYAATCLDGDLVKNENKLWLANYYYDEALNAKAPEQQTLSAKRAYYLFKDVLTQGDSWECIAIDEESLFLEAEVLKLAELMELSESNDKISLLKSLASKASSEPEWEWRFQRRTLFELAKTYELTGAKETALNTYSFIAETAKYSPSPLSFAALYKEALLRFDTLDAKSKIADNEQMIAVLNNLKELQIKKQVSTEPLHLKAAIDYASVRAQLSSKDEQNERHHFFLKRLKEDFYPSEDLNSQEYYSHLQENPEKNHLFQLHMRYVDAHMAYLEAAMALDNQDVETAKKAASKAKAFLSDIKSDAKATEYLKEKAQNTERALNGLQA